jgi:hypothetical protein
LSPHENPAFSKRAYIKTIMMMLWIMIMQLANLEMVIEEARASSMRDPSTLLLKQLFSELSSSF